MAKPLDAVKSTSFFDRVDNIEMSGAPKGGFSFTFFGCFVGRVLMIVEKGTRPRKKKEPEAKEGKGKQTTLLGMKKTMPPPRPQMSGDTEMDEETQGDEVPFGVLEDSLVSREVIASIMKLKDVDTGNGY